LDAFCYWLITGGPLQVVSRDIRTLLTQRAQYFNIVLDDVSITNLTFSREYTGAVEAKQVAQQDSERAKFIVSIQLLFAL
jgi:prohibitin 2